VKGVVSRNGRAGRAEVAGVAGTAGNAAGRQVRWRVAGGRQGPGG